MTDTLSILGNYYYLVGDVNRYTMPETAICYFNKEVAAANSAIVGDLYQTVRDHKWTFDYCFNMAKLMSRDNGDGVWDKNDTYGAIQNKICGTIGFFSAADYETVIMTKDGPKLNINTQKLNTILQKAGELIAKNNTSYVDRFDFAEDSTGIPIFFDDRALFYFDILLHASGFRDQESDFGLIPYPKFDEAQKEYVTYANQWGLSCQCRSPQPTPLAPVRSSRACRFCHAS